MLPWDVYGVVSRVNKITSMSILYLGCFFMALRRNEFYYTFPYFPLTVSVTNPVLVTKRNWFLIAVCN